MKKLLFAIFFGLLLTVARASDDDEDRGRGRGRGRGRDDDDDVSAIPEASTYAALGFVGLVAGITIYKHRKNN